MATQDRIYRTNHLAVLTKTFDALAGTACSLPGVCSEAVRHHRDAQRRTGYRRLALEPVYSHLFLNVSTPDQRLR